MFGPSDLMKASWSFASNSTCRFTCDERPSTMTGFLLPTRRISGLPAMRGLHSNEEGDGIFNQHLERGEQLGAERAIEDPVIAGHRHGHLAHELDAAVRRLDRRAPRGANCQDR